MTNSEQAIREIAEKWGFSQDKTDEGFLIDNDRTKQCLSDLTALISEGYYPKEFVEWKDANCTYLRGSGRYYAINDYPKTVYGDYVPYTIDELFEHWKTNEQ